MIAADSRMRASKHANKSANKYLDEIVQLRVDLSDGDRYGDGAFVRKRCVHHIVHLRKLAELVGLLSQQLVHLLAVGFADQQQTNGEFA